MASPVSGFCSSAEIGSRLGVPFSVPVWGFPFGCSRLEIPVWKFPFGDSRLEVPVWRLPFGVPVWSKGKKLVLSKREDRFCEVLETVKGMQQCKSQYYVHESNDFVDFDCTYGNDFVDFADMYGVLGTILLILSIFTMFSNCRDDWLILLICMAFWHFSDDFVDFDDM